MNKKKITGLVLSSGGIIFSRIDVLMMIENSHLIFFIKLLGIFLALLGILVFASGIKSSEKVMKICPECRFLNDASSELCKQCKKTLTKKS